MKRSGSIARESGWKALYVRDRANGLRLSVSVPPRGGIVVIRAGDRSVVIEWSELVHVERALRAARDEEC